MADTTANRTAIALVPEPREYFEQAIIDGGGALGPVAAETSGLVVAGGTRMDELNELLTEHPNIGWIQLHSAGVDAYTEVLRAHPERIWTSAKDSFAVAVTERILALTLAMLRRLPELVRTKIWGEEVGISLHGTRVVVIGAAGTSRCPRTGPSPLAIWSRCCRRPTS